VAPGMGVPAAVRTAPLAWIVASTSGAGTLCGAGESGAAEGDDAGAVACAGEFDCDDGELEDDEV
jgi:hypothetical protein